MSNEDTSGLTVEKLRASMKWLEKIGPPPDKFTIYGSTAVPNGHGYEIKKPDMLLFGALAYDPTGGRRIIIVPKDEEDRWFHELKSRGYDVQLNPQYRDREEKTDGDLEINGG